jgi:hypothetical protein
MVFSLFRLVQFDDTANELSQAGLLFLEVQGAAVKRVDIALAG